MCSQLSRLHRYGREVHCCRPSPTQAQHPSPLLKPLRPSPLPKSAPPMTCVDLLTCRVHNMPDWNTIPPAVATRSSAQCNCSAKSLAASVMSSILPCSSILLVLLVLHQSCCPRGVHGGVWLGGVWPRGVPQGGQGTFWSSCHTLHYHMVLRPKGTSHNQRCFLFCSAATPDANAV